MPVENENPVAMLAGGNRVRKYVLYRHQHLTHFPSLAQFLFPMTDMAGAMLEGLQ